MTDKSKREIGQRIRQRRIALNISQDELAKRIGYKSENSRSTINKIEMGINDISQSKLPLYAKALHTTESYVLGLDSEPQQYSDYGILPIRAKKLPILGEIACGKPIYADEEYSGYVTAGADMDADFCLIARGDSMVGARILDGDVVFIKKDSSVNNGEIAAVIIGDEATLKRVYYYPDKSKLVLNAENPRYEPLVYIGEELEQIRILGKAVAFQSVIK